jgi:hypothetical protein
LVCLGSCDQLISWVPVWPMIYFDSHVVVLSVPFILVSLLGVLLTRFIILGAELEASYFFGEIQQF